MTSMKVDSAVRDQLTQVARARGITVGSLLSEVAGRMHVDQRWAEIDAAYERLRRDDPTGWSEYLAELDMWDMSTAAPDTTASEEWPEYNQ